MSKARQLADLLDSNGDVVVGALDNAPDPDLTPYALQSTVDAITVSPTDVSDQSNTSTGYFDLPSGTTEQRPESPDSGFTRFNTTTGSMEFYTGSEWLSTNLIPIVGTLSGTVYNTHTSTVTVSVTNNTPTVDIQWFEGTTQLAISPSVTVSGGSASVSVPSGVYAKASGTAIRVKVANADGAVSDEFSNTLTVQAAYGSQANPASSLSALISTRGFTDGSVPQAIYWFDYKGTAPFPTAVHNLSTDQGTNSWLMVQKNFVPQAFKNGDGNNTGISYGLLNSGGSVIVTTAIDNNSASAPTTSDLGTIYAKVSVESHMSSGDFSQLLFKDRDGYFSRYSAGANSSTLYTRLVAGQAYSNTFENDAFYAVDWNNAPSARYIYFNTRMTAVDEDYMKMGMTYRNDIAHDYYNGQSEHLGTSWFNDGGGGGYSYQNRDSALDGVWGRFTIWVR